MVNKIEDTKVTAEVGSISELNLYLQAGWTLLLTYVRHARDSQMPRFVVGWQSEDEVVVPELLDEWEQRDLFRNTQI